MKSWRAKRYQLQLTRTRKIIITLRRFNTAKQHRSSKFKQLVISCQLGSVKELSIRVQKHRRLARAKHPQLRRRLVTMTPLLLITLGIAGSGFFGKQLLIPRKLEPPKTFAAAPVDLKKAVPAVPTIQPLPASTPTHINIPAVNIDADIMPVGQAADGSIQMPPILDWITGWYKYSPTPGQEGPSVIVGHVDNYESIWVFWRLRYLLPGNDIYITRADGSVVHFKVTALKQFSQADFPTQEVYGNINYPGLRLITCGGTFSTATGSYNQNTVVFASMVNN